MYKIITSKKRIEKREETYILYMDYNNLKIFTEFTHRLKYYMMTHEGTQKKSPSISLPTSQ